MEAVELRDGEKLVRIIPGERPDADSYEGGHFQLELVAPGLHAARRVFVFGWSDLGAFLGDLAATWQGWSGTRSWESPEHDLRIDATFGSGGHVHLRVSVQEGPVPGWAAHVEVNVDAGEDMAGLAQSVAAAVSPSRT